MATELDQLINEIYQRQLGRTADAEGAAYYAQQIASGRSPAEVEAEINRSLEGQNFDTQYLTSQYRQLFGRNPEQEGYQYWMSEAQGNPQIYGALLQEYLLGGASVDDAKAAAARGAGYTNVQSADLEADPFGGRYATTSIYDLPTDAVNISQFGDTRAQFVAPVTQRPVITTLQDGSFAATAGLDVLSSPVVQAAVSRALDSGAMSQDEYNTMLTDLTKATNMDDVYAAFNKPQAQVVLDAVYGLQTGQANTLEEAQAQAARLQPVIDAINQGFYPSNFTIAEEAARQGVPYAFGQDAYTGYNTMMTEADVVNDANFQNRVNQVLQGLTAQFGQPTILQTPLGGQYYSERGLEAGYTPFGEGQPMFRSGVAGYTPNLPTGFQFGINPVNAVVPQFIPGTFGGFNFDVNGNIVGELIPTALSPISNNGA